MYRPSKHLDSKELQYVIMLLVMECCEIFTCMCKCHLLLQLGRARITATVHQYGTEEGLYF